MEQIRETGAKYVAAPCSNCKRQLGQLLEHHKTGVTVGGLHDIVSRAIVIESNQTTQEQRKEEAVRLGA